MSVQKESSFTIVTVTKSRNLMNQDDNGNTANTSNIFGGDGNDTFSHVQNAPVEIDGGDGIDGVTGASAQYLNPT